jgi:glycosyltransferase involved in cell wall biosynthesis
MFIDIAQQATVITTVSEYLLRQTEEVTGRKDIKYLSNGVDTHMFKNNTDNNPGDISGIPHPRITFVGAITSWIDMDILSSVAGSSEDFQLVLIGSIDYASINNSKLEKLKSMKNVHFLGGKPYDSVPSYLHASDVLLLPRTMDPYSLACDPLKLYEYLATGKPVVSTDHPSIKRFSEFVNSGKNGAEIVAGIKEALSRSNEISLKQKNIVDSLSWETRISQLLELVKFKIIEKTN